MLILEIVMNKHNKVIGYDFPQLTHGESIVIAIQKVQENECFTDSYKAEFKQRWERIASNIAQNNFDILRKDFTLVFVYPHKIVHRHEGTEKVTPNER